MNLYQISEEVSRLSDLLQRDADGEATAEDREALAAYVEGMKTLAEEKADGYAKAIREHQAMAKARREEAMRLRDLADAEDARADRLSRFVCDAMRKMGMDRMHGMVFKLRVQQNGGKQPIDVFAATDEIPPQWQDVTMTVKPDKEKLRAALEAGDAEAAKYACLMERGYGLRIG